MGDARVYGLEERHARQGVEARRRLDAGAALFRRVLRNGPAATSAPESKRLNAITNPHSPEEYRINGVVSNMPEFAQGVRVQGRTADGARAGLRVW